MPTVQREDEIDKAYEDRFTAIALHQAESENPDHQPGTTDMSGFERSYADASGTAGELSDREGSHDLAQPQVLPDKSANKPWSNKVTQPTQVPQKGIINQMKKVGKKRGAAGLATILLGGGIIGLSTFSFPVMMLQHITANYTNKFNLQQAAVDVRSDKILRKMFSGDGATRGVCTEYVSFRCKYEKMSDKTLKKMIDDPQKRVTPLDADGKPMDPKDSRFTRSRPASFDYIDPATGAKRNIPASTFASEFRNNQGFRVALTESFSPRWQVFNDHITKNVLNRLRITKASNYTDLKTEKEINAKIDDVANGDSKATVVNAAEQPQDNDTEEQKKTKADINQNTDEAVRGASNAGEAIENGAVKSASQIVRSGNLVGLVATGYCTIVQGSGALSTALRATQMAIAMRAAFEVVKTADQVRKGDATPELASAFGNRLTETKTDGQGNIVQAAATDGWGMRNALNNESVPSVKDNYNQFLPGAGAAAAITAFTTAVGGNNSAIKAACGAVNSAPGQFGLALLGGPASIVGFAAGTAMAPLLEGIVGNLMQRIVGTIAGRYFDANVRGEGFGNMFDIGFRNYMSESAIAGGGGAMSHKQAADYERLNSQVRLAYARDDRASLSPLDASNPNTALGSVFTRFIPMMSSMSSVTSLVTQSIATTTSSLSSILSPRTYAAEPIQDYSLCDDPNLKGVAAGPACNIIAGVPPDVMNSTSIEQVLNELVGQYDENTGEVNQYFPGTEIETPLYKWQENCLPGGGDAAKFVENCKVDTHENQMLALFFIDRRTVRIINSEDGSDESQNSSSSSGSGSFVSGETKDLAAQILASPNVKFQVEPAQRKAFEEIASTGKQSTCGGVAISPKLMGVLLGISQKYKITVGVLTTGHGCDGGNHSTGHAADLNGVVSLDGSRSTSNGGQFINEIDLTSNPLMKDFIQDLMAIIAESGGGSMGQQQAWSRQGIQVPSGVVTCVDTAHHLHISAGGRGC